MSTLNDNDSIARRSENIQRVINILEESKQQYETISLRLVQGKTIILTRLGHVQNSYGQKTIIYISKLGYLYEVEKGLQGSCSEPEMITRYLICKDGSRMQDIADRVIGSFIENN